MKTTRLKQTLTLILAIIVMAAMLIGCDSTALSTDRQATIQAGSTLSENQPTPTDIEFSLERFNLIRRAYWINGQREKAQMVECPIERPLGYVVLLTPSGAIVGRFVVDGKVSSLNSYLTPDSTRYGGEYTSYWLPDVDGAYGSNDLGIFFFTPDGHYYEWDSNYLYSDEPIEVENPIIIYHDD